MLKCVHNGYPRTLKMGLSRILTSFSTISFSWFYLFIMLENAEAKIGESGAAMNSLVCGVDFDVCFCLS